LSSTQAYQAQSCRREGCASPLRFRRTDDHRLFRFQHGRRAHQPRGVPGDGRRDGPCRRGDESPAVRVKGVERTLLLGRRPAQRRSAAQAAASDREFCRPLSGPTRHREAPDGAPRSPLAKPLRGDGATTRQAESTSDRSKSASEGRPRVPANDFSPMSAAMVNQRWMRCHRISRIAYRASSVIGRVPASSSFAS
jgi:hypothetical protein